jgi:hypothetical protein
MRMAATTVTPTMAMTIFRLRLVGVRRV